VLSPRLLRAAIPWQPLMPYYSLTLPNRLITYRRLSSCTRILRAHTTFSRPTPTVLVLTTQLHGSCGTYRRGRQNVLYVMDNAILLIILCIATRAGDLYRRNTI